MLPDSPQCQHQWRRFPCPPPSPSPLLFSSSSSFSLFPSLFPFFAFTVRSRLRVTQTWKICTIFRSGAEGLTRQMTTQTLTGNNYLRKSPLSCFLKCIARALNRFVVSTQKLWGHSSPRWDWKLRILFNFLCIVWMQSEMESGTRILGHHKRKVSKKQDWFITIREICWFVTTFRGAPSLCRVFVTPPLLAYTILQVFVPPSCTCRHSRVYFDIFVCGRFCLFRIRIWEKYVQLTATTTVEFIFPVCTVHSGI